MKGIIDGKRAREYAKVVKNDKNNPYTKFILDNIKFKTNVCDIGCGSGVSIEVLHDKVKHIDGVDLSKEMIKICKEKFKKIKNVKIRYVSATNTKLKSNFYDVVIIRMTLHHIKDKEGVLKEAKRILKKNGRVLLLDEYMFKPIKYHLTQIWKWDAYTGHFFWSKKRTFDLIEKYFKIVKLEIKPLKRCHYVRKFFTVLKE